MNDEIKGFIDFSDDDDENTGISHTRLINAKIKSLSTLNKAIGTAFIIVVFALTALIAYKYDNSANLNKISADDTTVISSSDNNAVSNRYKIKTIELFYEDTLIIRGLLNITKDDLKSLSNAEIPELFGYISSKEEYSWVTVKFSDGTGIVILPDNNNIYFYGKLDKNGLISNPYGTVLKASEDNYIYIDSQNITTDNNVSNTQESTDGNEDKQVYITASGTKYHFEGCSYLTESSVKISLEKAKEQGYLPCSRCIK